MTVLLAAVSNTNVFSQDMETKKTVTPQGVVENVHKAAELLKTKGKEGLEILRDPQYELNTGDAYIFIIDVEESLVVSNPRFPERNGGNIREHLDWAGKHYGIELCDVAMQGGGWIEFVWPKPGSTEGVRKISYIYDNTMSLDELNRMSGVSPKSPKVAVLFEVKPKTEGKEEYPKLAAALKTELAKMPGFIRVERFGSLNEEGKLLSLSVWENKEAAAAWRNQISHRGSQKKRHDALFERYHISVASIIREYTQDDRKEAPADSNQFLGIK